ncbi:MAG: response regulator transcription factor [Rhizobacter sp.]|nr:response regulator transcription factor [Rhizobacter sp.]
MDATALIAEDEPLLADELAHTLAKAWPELRVVARAGDGPAAVDAALRLTPDVLFLDIRMPGMSGLEAAHAIAEDWPDATLSPLVVFVTAYERHALEAFDHASVDYLLKPIDAPRVARTVARLQALLAARWGERRGAADASPALDAERDGAGWQRLLGSPEAMRSLLGAAATPRLETIAAGSGSAIHFVPVREVVYFEAADKYVRVLTADREHLIRISLRELLPQLDPARFWQVHRGTVVRADAIARAERDDAGKVTLVLRERPERIVVSRLYAHRFRPM